MVDIAVIGKGARGGEWAWPVFWNEAATLCYGCPEETGGKYEATVHASCLVEWSLMQGKNGTQEIVAALEYRASQKSVRIVFFSPHTPHQPIESHLYCKIACVLSHRAVVLWIV